MCSHTFHVCSDLQKSTFGSLLQWHKCVKEIPEKIVYKGFTYAFKEVKSEVCADSKCKFVTEIIYLGLAKSISGMPIKFLIV